MNLNRHHSAALPHSPTSYPSQATTIHSQSHAHSHSHSPSPTSHHTNSHVNPYRRSHHHSHSSLHTSFSKVSSSPALISATPRLYTQSRESSPTNIRNNELITDLSNETASTYNTPATNTTNPNLLPHSITTNSSALSVITTTSSTVPSSLHRSSISSASPIINSTTSSSSPAYFKLQYDIANEANRALESRVEALDRENRDLKRSVYELSYLYSQCVHQMKHVGILPPPFDYTLISTNLNTSPLQLTNHNWMDHAGSTVKSSIGTSKNPHEPHKSVLPTSSSHLASLSTTDHTSSSDKSALQLKPFIRRLDFLGHTSAIYAISFSRNGKYVATGSMDKSLKIWDIDSHLTTSSSTQHQPSLNSSRRELLSLSEHTMTISDVAWNLDGTLLFSAAFDKTVRIWDVHNGSLLSTFDMPGFPQSVRYEAQYGCLYVGSTSKKISCIDLRSKNIIKTFENDSMVSSVEIVDSKHIWSGDHNGNIRVWDARKGSCLYQLANGSACKPISHLHVGCNLGNRSPTRSDPLHEYFLAVNSFDDILRVYTGGKQAANPQSPFNSSVHHSPTKSASCTHNSSNPFALHLRHELRGHKNQNWPIRSSFYIGNGYDGADEWRMLNEHSLSSASSSPSSSPISSTDEDDDVPDLSLEQNSRIIPLEDPNSVNSHSDELGDTSQPANSLLHSQSRHARTLKRPKRPSLAMAGLLSHTSIPFSINQTALLATGSADAYAYVFDVGRPEGEGKLLQRLEGHRDRVYVCAFHPTEPILVTGSADTTAKVWTAKAG